MHTCLFENIRDGPLDDPEDYPGTPECRFTIQTNEMKVVFECSQEFIPCERWDKLVQAIESNGSADLLFLTVNGEISISTRDGMTAFCLARHGSDNCGEVTITIPNWISLNAIKEAAKALKEWQQK